MLNIFLMLLLFFLIPIYIYTLFKYRLNRLLLNNATYQSSWADCSCRYVRRNELDAGFPIFESESLKWPGFVEFDSVNGKVLIYAPQQGYAFFNSSFFFHSHIDLIVILLCAVSIRSLTWRTTPFYIRYNMRMCRI